MASEHSAAVSRGPGKSTVTVQPTDCTSIRTVERTLRAAGIPVTVAWDTKRAFVPLADSTKIIEALRGWKVILDSGVRQQIERTAQEIRRVLLGKQVIEDVRRSEAVEELLTGFADGHRLDQHQREAVAVITHPDISGMCLFDEQGLGKTVTTLFSYHRLRQLGEVTRMLIIAPKTMVFEWVRENERFLGNHYKVLPVVGGEREKRDSLNQAADIYVTNFETTVNLFLRLRELLEGEEGRAFLVVDESFFVKNSDAQRTQAIRRLRRSVRRCLVLCGTPAPNSPHDLVEQFNIADGGIAFHGVRLAPEREAARPVVRRAIEDRGIYMRRLKQDVLPELPDKTFNRILVPMGPQQERIYHAALQQLVSDLKATDDISFKKHITSFLARRTALQQICSNPNAVVTGYQETPAKLLALDSVLDELIGRRREKVIVWSFFTISLGAIYTRYRHFNPVRFDGQVPDPAVRREAIRRFQEDCNTMLFVGNPAAAGAGLTLHRARFAVYESMSNQAAHFLQSLDRIHRRGQERGVEYLVLLCDRTLELQEYDRLTSKERAAQELLGDDVVAPVTRETMLAEAIVALQLLGQGRPSCIPARPSNTEQTRLT